MMMNASSLEAFKKSLEEISEMVESCFKKSKSHIHLMMLLDEDGRGEVVEVDPYIDQAMVQYKSLDRAKDMVYAFFSKVIRETKPTAYIEISEGYALHLVSQDDKALNPEEANRQFNSVKERFGSIKETPGRQEILFVKANYKGQYAVMRTWKILRNGKQAELSTPVDSKMATEDLLSSRSGHLDSAMKEANR